MIIHGKDLLECRISVYCFAGDVTLLSMRVTLSMIGKLGISGAFTITVLYTPELFPTTLRSH